jgi:hypothetical protein
MLAETAPSQAADSKPHRQRRISLNRTVSVRLVTRPAQGGNAPPKS